VSAGFAVRPGRALPVIDSVGALIRFHEGRRYQCYDDATRKPLAALDPCIGTPTIGEGHTGPEVVPGLIWTDGQIDAAKAKDIALATSRAAAAVGAEWPRIDAVRQAALIDMAFELGGAGLAGFRHMLAAVRIGEWSAAHDFALDSKVAREQAPKRWACDAAMLLTGRWPVLAARA
jgi:lysozyme